MSEKVLCGTRGDKTLDRMATCTPRPCSDGDTVKSISLGDANFCFIRFSTASRRVRGLVSKQVYARATSSVTNQIKTGQVFVPYPKCSAMWRNTEKGALRRALYLPRLRTIALCATCWNALPISASRMRCLTTSCRRGVPNPPSHSRLPRAVAHRDGECKGHEQNITGSVFHYLCSPCGRRAERKILLAWPTFVCSGAPLLLRGSCAIP